MVQLHTGPITKLNLSKRFNFSAPQSPYMCVFVQTNEVSRLYVQINILQLLELLYMYSICLQAPGYQPAGVTSRMNQSERAYSVISNVTRESGFASSFARSKPTVLIKVMIHIKFNCANMLRCVCQQQLVQSCYIVSNFVTVAILL